MNGFDPQVIESLREALGDSVSKIITIYVEEMPITLQSMRAALAKEDYATVARLAHSLKSSSGNLGLQRISELSIALENSAMSELKNNADLEAAIMVLEQTFVAVQPKLQAYIL